jgi:acetyl esterase/lipase
LPIGKGISHRKLVLGGSPGVVPGRYRDLSPISRVDPGDPPTFLAYGDDRIVPPGQSELLGERLEKAGVAHRLVELPWANHTFDFLWGGWSSQITRSALQHFRGLPLPPLPRLRELSGQRGGQFVLYSSPAPVSVVYGGRGA